MLKPYSLLTIGLLSALAPAQGRVALMTQLEAEEGKANSADELVALSTWAKQNGMRTDHLRLLNKALRLDEDHETARTTLGYVKHDGSWMLQAKVDFLAGRAHREKMQQQGLVEVDGIWVEAAQLGEAAGGLFYHEGKKVSRSEKAALTAGKVRHPTTGAFIAPEDLEKAQEGLFPKLDGKWVDQEEADLYHSDVSRPWLLRTEFATVAMTLPLSNFEEVKGHIDDAIRTVGLFFGDHEVHPGHRPTIWVCADVEQFQAIGNQIGDERSVYGAFVAESEPLIEGAGLPHAPAVANWGERQPWGIYYLRCAAAMAYADSIGLETGAGLPQWLVVGAGSYSERHYQPQIAKFFGQRHLEAGGVRGLESWGVASLNDWFEGFAISSALEEGRVEHNIFQAGLMLSYCLNGNDEAASAAAADFRSALSSGEGVEAAVSALQAALATKEAELWAYLKDVIENG